MTTNETASAADQGTGARGFGYLPCPRCLATGMVRLDLSDLDTCACTECDEEFTLADVRGLIAAWAPVLAWIDSAPRAG